MTQRYKPPVVKDAGGKGDSGVADLLWSDTKVKIAFEENETAYKILRDELPEYAQDWDLEKAFVTMDGENEKVFSIRPVSGVFTVKSNGFSRQNEEEPPAPQQRTGKWGPYYTMNALLEVVKGKFKGTIYAYYLYYKFADFDGVVGIKGDGTASMKLMDFLDTAGAWEDGELEYDDNILPVLEKRIKHAKKIFQIVVKKGYIESVLEADFESGEEDEDETPKKKQAKEEDVDEDFPAKNKSPLKKSSKGDDDLD